MFAWVLLCLALPFDASAQSLAWKWTPGASTRYRVTETMHQETSGTNAADLEWTRVIEFTESVAASDSGGVVLTRSYDAVRVRVSGTHEAEYDSKNPSQRRPDPLVAPFAGLVGAVVVISLDESGRVTAVEGAREAIDAMLGPLRASAPGPGADQLRVPPGDGLARQIQGGLDLLPGKDVRRGDTWNVRIPHPLPLVGDLATELECRLDRIESGGLATITMSGRMVQPRDADSPPTLLELKRSTIEGKIVFDTNAGAVATQRIASTSDWSVALELAESLGGAGSVQTIRHTAELTRID